MKKGESVEIECPKCKKKQTVKFKDYSVKCEDCGHWITESEWDEINS